VNISDIHLGRSPAGEAALMVLSTDQPVPADVIDRLRAESGIVRVHPISQD
jgi:hypothetical protein